MSGNFKNMNKYITNREIHDEDWKTQSAKGYPNIPANEEVEVIEIYSNFYGRYVRIKWHDNIYDTYPSYIRRLK